MGIGSLRTAIFSSRETGCFAISRIVLARCEIKAGRREILTSLRTKDRKAAELPYLKAHVAAEEWLQSLVAVDQPGRKPAVPLLSIPPINGLSASPAPNSAYERRSAGWGRNPLSEALRVYLDRSDLGLMLTGVEERKIRYDEKHRLMGYLIEALGSDRDVASLARQDARTFRDFLGRRGLKPEIGFQGDQHRRGDRSNGTDRISDRHQKPTFTECMSSAGIAAVDARLPLTARRSPSPRPAAVNVQLSTIVDLLALTIARLNEIAGLEWSDVHGLSTDGHDVASIAIRTNRIRRLKTANSKRQIRSSQKRGRRYQGYRRFCRLAGK